LWEPVKGDAGAHGVFDDRAQEHSVQLWMNERRGWLLAAAGVAVLGIVAMRRR
jgi:hypothetical protein